MIGNVTMGNYFKGALNYIFKIGVDLPEDKKPVQIETNNVVGNVKQMAWQMAEHALNSRRLLKPVLHISVSFAPQDNLTQAEEVEAVKAYIKYFGISEEKHQYVIVKHFDSNHPHYHIITNKLNLDNQSLNVDWYKNDAIAIADRVEQELNLFHVQGRARIFDLGKGLYRNVSKADRVKIIENRQTKVFRDKPLNLNEYQTIIRNCIDIVVSYATSLDEVKTELAKVNIQATFRTDPASGRFIGAAFRFGEKIRVKGSDVGYSANVINEIITKNKENIKATSIEDPISSANKTQSTDSDNSKDYHYHCTISGNGTVVIEKQFYFEPEEDNLRLTKLYIDEDLALRVTQNSGPNLDIGTSNLRNGANFSNNPITERISQTIPSSNDLEEFKDVIITQDNAPDFDDNSIADADKKKKPIIRRKMRR